jgi:carboxyl-terminal processing protease
MIPSGCVLIALIACAPAFAEEKPKEKPAWIGVQLRVGKDEGSVEVVRVLDNSPAEKAGLKSGDLILRINGVKPTNLSTAVKVVRLLTPGKKATLLIGRDGKEKKIEIVPQAAE